MDKKLPLWIILTFFFFSVPCDALANEGEILFHDVVGESFSIFKVRPDGGGLKKIIKDGAYPVWSRDRKKIAYISLAPETQNVRSTAKLRISDSGGKELFKVEGIKNGFKDEKSSAFSVGYEWSHDGNRLAFATILRNRLYLQVFDILSRKIANICQKEIEDTTRAYLDTKMAWAFDDKYIFFTSERGGIEVIDLQNGVIGYIVPQGVPSSLSEGEDKIILAFQKGEFISFWSIDEQGKQGDDFEIKGKFLPVSGPIKSNLLVAERSPDKISTTYLFDLRSRKKKNIQTGNVLLFSASLSPKGDKVIAIGLMHKGLKNMKEEGAEAGYYILDLKTEETYLLRKFSHPRDKGYWMNVYLGKRRDYSWR